MTVDEVGDVTDLPQSSAEPMETTEGGDGALTSVQQDAAGVKVLLHIFTCF